MSNLQKRFYVLRKINQLDSEESRVALSDMLFYSDKSLDQVLSQVKKLSLSWEIVLHRSPTIKINH